MKSKLAIGVFLFLVGALVWFFLSRKSQEVTMVLVNGVVYTADETQPRAEAVALRGDRIVAIGSTTDIDARFHGEQRIDLHGATVVPGFIDSHAHLEGLGLALSTVDLTGSGSIQEIQTRLVQRQSSLPAGVWLRGQGWDQNRWPEKVFPTHADLDAIAPERPAYLVRVDGHAVWVNAKVLSMAGITQITRDPEGGRIVRDAAGNPTGVFVDNAIDLLATVLPKPSAEERTHALRNAIEECLRYGLTEVHDMGIDAEGIDILRGLLADSLYAFRVYAAIDGLKDTTWNFYLGRGPEINALQGRLNVRALKMYADGALGSRGAALLEPYSDDPGNRGLTLTSRAELSTAAGQALDHGFQLCVHAIGDRANAIVLSVYEDAFKGRLQEGMLARFRIEHAQVIAPGDFEKFHRLGILPMMQPTHATSDMPWAENRLGPERVKGAYAWRTLLRDGNIVPGGSDFPIESPNPLLGFYAAITRQDRSGQPEGGWYPDQRMTRDEALKSFTLWGAYAGFQEKDKGTLVPGKWADIVVLSDDIMQIEPAKIPDVKVLMTIVGGRIAFDARAGAGR